MATTMTKPDYGAPLRGLQIHLFIVGMLLFVGGSAVRYFVPELSLWWVVLTVAVVSHIGLAVVGVVALFRWVITVGRFRDRDRMLDSINWRGDEKVLDVGCGEGVVALAAAKRVPRGHVVGIDDWSPTHGRRPMTAKTARANAVLEGVEDRVDIRDGDATKIEFPDACFDVVLASFSIHHVGDEQQRAVALGEMVRVLKPGGEVVIIDPMFNDQIASVLQARGLAGVTRESQTFPSFLFRWIRGTKPARQQLR